MESKVLTILLVLFLTIKSNSTEETEPKPKSNFATNGLQEFKYQAMSVSSLDNHFGLIYNYLERFQVLSMDFSKEINIILEYFDILIFYGEGLWKRKNLNILMDSLEKIKDIKRVNQVMLHNAYHWFELRIPYVKDKETNRIMKQIRREIDHISSQLYLIKTTTEDGIIKLIKMSSSIESSNIKSEIVKGNMLSEMITLEMLLDTKFYITRTNTALGQIKNLIRSEDFDLIKYNKNIRKEDEEFINENLENFKTEIEKRGLKYRFRLHDKYRPLKEIGSSLHQDMDSFKRQVTQVINGFQEFLNNNKISIEVYDKMTKGFDKIKDQGFLLSSELEAAIKWIEIRFPFESDEELKGKLLEIRDDLISSKYFTESTNQIIILLEKENRNLETSASLYIELEKRFNELEYTDQTINLSNKILLYF